MKRLTLMTSILLAMTALQEGRAAVDRQGTVQSETSTQPQPGKVQVRVLDGDWGRAQPAEIEDLLNAIARDLLAHFPGRRIGQIVVAPSTQGPVVLYQRGAQREYQVLLAAKGRNWGEYVYEFSHEFLHILARYDLHQPHVKPSHKWFEETVCEAASLYMLGKYARTWEQSAPRPEWRAYSREMVRFAERAFNEHHRRLPRNVSFEQWFLMHEQALIHKPHLREKNELVAMQLLPILEQTGDWRALEYLNVDPGDDGSRFHEFLVRWHQATPRSQRALISQTFSLFRYRPPGKTQAVAASGGYTWTSTTDKFGPFDR